MLAWAADNGWRADNPALRVEKFKEANDREAWPQEMIDLVRDHGPPWMWQAVALALYTAQRQGDCLRMRWDQIDKQGRITVRPKKTQKAGVKKLEIMIHPELRKVLDTIPRSSVRILNDARGVPWRSSFAFRASWRKALLKGPLTAIAESKLVFHSLRRTAVEQMLLSGNSHQLVQSITAQTYATIERYAANMRRTELGDAAIERWDQHGRRKR